MSRKFYYGGSMLAACLTMAGMTAAIADTTTTTTILRGGTSSSFVLPSSQYVVVDPLSGRIRGEYSQTVRTVDGVPLGRNFVVMDKLSRRLVATFDDNGNVIDISAAPAASDVILSVNSHRAALENQINSLALQGQITDVQAQRLRLEIAKLSPPESTVTTYPSALGVNSELCSVESQLLSIAPKNYTAVIAPSFIAMRGQIILPDDLTRRKFSLERKMDDQFAAGRLTQNQLTQLKADMYEIYNREALYRVSGLMSDGDAALLSADLNAFQSKLDFDLSNSTSALQSSLN